jgi:hypothetical protein
LLVGVRARSTAVAIALATLLVLFVSLGKDHDPKASARADHRAAAGGPAYRAQLTVAATRPAQRVPTSFLGVSTEYWSLPWFEREIPLLARVMTLMRVRGDGPLSLRIGGDSADHTVWAPQLRPHPDWMFALTPGWLRAIRALLRLTGARLIEDLNLVTGSPAAAASWAGVTERALPRGAIAGFEIGNEPDIYSRSYWDAITARTSYPPPVLPQAISSASYLSDYAQYASALAYWA